MKTKHWLAAWLMAASFTACEYDDSELKSDVSNLKDRITALEGQVNQMNEDIVSLQNIINAVDQQIGITQVEQNADGYTLHFTDGTSIDLHNGEDGKDGTDTPIIGIAQENGTYYWTMTTDGETSWLTDDEGNKLPVTGTAGVTPLLKVDDEGYWTVSYDQGNTYTQVTDDEGNPVQAIGKDGQNGTPGTSGTPGKDGDSFFQSVTQDSEKVILILADGTVINIPKAKAFGIAFEQTENIPLDKDGITLPYTVTGADADTQVRAFVSKGNLEVTVSEGSIIVKPAGENAPEGNEVIVLLFNKERTITTLLTFVIVPEESDTDGATEDYEVEEGIWD